MFKLIGSLTMMLACAGVAPAELEPRLAELQPFVGKTFTGTFTEPGSDEPARDVQVWEEILGGQAVRITHSLNEGAYGGESIVFFDTKQNQVAFYYFTTGGFYTHGTMSHADGVWTGHEVVESGGQSVSEVRTTTRLLPDGGLATSAEFLRDGKWEPGHEVIYREDPDAELVFK